MTATLTERTKQTFVKGATQLIFICEKSTDISHRHTEKIIEKAIAECKRFCQSKLLSRCEDGGFYVYKLKIHTQRTQKSILISTEASFSDRGKRKTLLRCSRSFRLKESGVEEAFCRRQKAT